MSIQHLLRSAAAAALMLAAQSATAAIITFSAPLSPGPENPSPVLNGASPTGVGTGRYDTDTNLFSGSLSWSGTTSAVTMGHIHAAAVPGGNGPVLIGYFMGVQLPTTDSFELAPFALSTSQASGLLAGLEAGTLYFNLHTVLNPPGEIRGNIDGADVPEPAALGLLGLGVLGLLTARRRRS